MNTGICPVCNGSGRIPAGDYKWKTMTAGYDTKDDTLACRNCGGQTMAVRGTGKVLLRDDGTPCVHEYTGVQAGNCYYQYTCIHCGDRYSIDSGD